MNNDLLKNNSTSSHMNISLEQSGLSVLSIGQQVYFHTLI